MTIADHHAQALAAVAPIVAGVAPEQLAADTPCAGWDVRTVLNHVISGNLWAVELVGGKTIDEVGNRLDGDLLGDDPHAAFDASATAAAEAFRAPGALDAPCAVSYGPVPGSVYAGHRFLDVLIHGWDLAKATGQDTTIDPALVSAAFAVIKPQLDMVRGSGVFGDDLPVADGADDQTRLLAILGRRA